MATQSETYRCDLSGRRFPSRADVRGGLSIDTGSAFYVYGDVSPAAAQAVLGFIAGRFPKATPIVRKTHASSSPEPVKSSQQLASDEDNAIERAREEGIL
jgi:hypothetical protein